MGWLKLQNLEYLENGTWFFYEIKKILNLCLRWHILRSYCFLAEVIFKSKATFQEEWLTGKLYKDWITQDKNKNYAKCVLCLKDIDLLTMGSATLDSHAKGAKHKAKKIKDRSTGLDLFFKKPNQTPVESQEQQQPSASTLDTCVLNDSPFNAEILWRLKGIKCHFSLRSCESLGKLFWTLLPDSELASKFTWQNEVCLLW